MSDWLGACASVSRCMRESWQEAGREGAREQVSESVREQADGWVCGGEGVGA